MHMASTFIPTFGRLYGTINVFRATDHDALLKAPELMAIGTEQVFEKAHLILGHGCKSVSHHDRVVAEKGLI
jgi:hypothetical protein